MLKKIPDKQTELEFVSIEQLVPGDHLLRTIDKVIDFEFIRDKVRGLYCTDNGRPAIDPVVLFKMLFIGYLFGIRSERALVRDIEVNVAYRWFLGLGLTEKVPDASTLSQNRRRRFSGSAIYQEIFDGIVEQAIGHKMVGGRVLYSDSTHLKASANKQKFTRKAVAKSTRRYLAELERDVNADRLAHGKAPLPPKPPRAEVKEARVSTTDGDSGYMAREDKPRGFYYLDHRTVDGAHSIITDSHATPATVHDSEPYLDRLDRQRARFGFEVAAVGLDAGYNTAAICKGLEDRNIYGVIGYRRPSGQKGDLPKREFVYDEYYDCYLCPQNQVLSYQTTSRDGYRHYASEARLCRDCPLLSQCTRSAHHVKVLTRHVWQDHKEAVDEHRLTDHGKRIYARRKETVERSFADAKQLHGHRYGRLRGLEKIGEQCLLAAACQNMKKIALAVVRGGCGALRRLLRPLWQQIPAVSPCTAMASA